MFLKNRFRSIAITEFNILNKIDWNNKTMLFIYQEPATAIETAENWRISKWNSWCLTRRNCETWPKIQSMSKVLCEYLYTINKKDFKAMKL